MLFWYLLIRYKSKKNKLKFEGLIILFVSIYIKNIFDMMLNNKIIYSILFIKI